MLGSTTPSSYLTSMAYLLCVRLFKRSRNSVTRLGNFFKFLVTNFPQPKYLVTFWTLEKALLFKINCRGYF